MRIREASPADAAKLIGFFRTLYAETTFMLFEPDEFIVTAAMQAQRIEENARAESGAMFVCEVDGDLVGAAFGLRGGARRTRHSMNVVIGILRGWTGRGMGRALLDALEGWARSHGVHRLELAVDVNNRQAITLYERCGFEREGLKQHSRRIDGRYADEWHMSKLLGARARPGNEDDA